MTVTLGNEWLTVEEVAKELKFQVSTIYGWIHAKKDPLPHIKLGKKSYRVPARLFHEWKLKKFKQ